MHMFINLNRGHHLVTITNFNNSVPSKTPWQPSPSSSSSPSLRSCMGTAALPLAFQRTAHCWILGFYLPPLKALSTNTRPRNGLLVSTIVMSNEMITKLP